MIARNKQYESDFQSDICSSVTSWGWIYVKNDPGPGGAPKGFPDLTVYGPDNLTVFLECKRPGEDAEPMQKHWARVLRRLGHSVYLVRNHGHAVRVLRREHERAVERGGDQSRRTG